MYRVEEVQADHPFGVQGPRGDLVIGPALGEPLQSRGVEIVFFGAESVVLAEH